MTESDITVTIDPDLNEGCPDPGSPCIGATLEFPYEASNMIAYAGPGVHTDSQNLVGKAMVGAVETDCGPFYYIVTPDDSAQDFLDRCLFL